jgi:hypothetical protein
MPPLTHNAHGAVCGVLLRCVRKHTAHHTALIPGDTRSAKPDEGGRRRATATADRQTRTALLLRAMERRKLATSA